MITLAPAALEHAPILQALFEDPEVIEHLAFPSPYPPGEMARYLAMSIAGRAAGTRYVWVTIEPDGTPSGIALLKDVDRAAGIGELGYAFGRRYWGGGRATAAVDSSPSPFDEYFGQTGAVAEVDSATGSGSVVMRHRRRGSATGMSRESAFG